MEKSPKLKSAKLYVMLALLMPAFAVAQQPEEPVQIDCPIAVNRLAPMPSCAIPPANSLDFDDFIKETAAYCVEGQEDVHILWFDCNGLLLREEHRSKDSASGGLIEVFSEFAWTDPFASKKTTYSLGLNEDLGGTNRYEITLAYPIDYLTEAATGKVATSEAMTEPQFQTVYTVSYSEEMSKRAIRKAKRREKREDRKSKHATTNQV